MDSPQLITITMPDGDDAEEIIVTAIAGPRQVRPVNRHRSGRALARPARAGSSRIVSDPPRPYGLCRWSPLRPFDEMRANYHIAHRALGRSGAMRLACICIAAGLAAVVWRHQATLIGVVAGLLISGMLLVRTGAYREYLAAIEELHGLPSAAAVLRYNTAYALRKAGSLWRR